MGFRVQLDLEFRVGRLERKLQLRRTGVRECAERRFNPKP